MPLQFYSISNFLQYVLEKGKRENYNSSLSVLETLATWKCPSPVCFPCELPSTIKQLVIKVDGGNAHALFLLDGNFRTTLKRIEILA